MSTSNFPPIRKVITFLAGLALKQNSPEIALELLSLIKTRYIDSRCLKILTYSKLNRFNDVMFLLKKSLEGNYKIKETYFSDVVCIIKLLIILLTLQYKIRILIIVILNFRLQHLK